MENDKSTESTCPSCEDLSAWFDEELENDSVGRHVMDCPACQKSVEDFQTLNDSIGDLIMVDIERIHRIGSNCVSKIDTEKPKAPTFLNPFWMKVAAGILIFGIVFLTKESDDAVNFSSSELASSDESRIAPSKSSTNQIYHNPIKPTYTATSSDPYSSGQPVMLNTENDIVSYQVSTTPGDITVNHSPRRRERLMGGADYRRSDGIRLVGFGFDDSYQTLEKYPRDLSNPDEAPIDGNVHHIWTMEDPVIPLIFLKTKTIHQGQQGVFDRLIRQGQDRYHLEFRITDKDLQELVNRLDSMDCELLSPDPPQPLPTDNFDASGRIFHYEVDFIKR